MDEILSNLNDNECYPLIMHANTGEAVTVNRYTIKTATFNVRELSAQF